MSCPFAVVSVYIPSPPPLHAPSSCVSSISLLFLHRHPSSVNATSSFLVFTPLINPLFFPFSLLHRTKYPNRGTVAKGIDQCDGRARYSDVFIHVHTRMENGFWDVGIAAKILSTLYAKNKGWWRGIANLACRGVVFNTPVTRATRNEGRGYRRMSFTASCLPDYPKPVEYIITS